MVRITAIAGILLLLVLALAGCQIGDQAQLPGDETVLVKVEGQPISRYDLDSAIKSMLGTQQADLLDEKNRNKVLDSLVLSRVMALKAEQELSPQENAELEKKVDRYREQLLAKIYLTAHAEPRPITNQMISDYYDQHPELFGQKTLYQYEILTGKIETGEENRQALLATLQQARAASDWNMLSKRWKDEGKAVDYRQAKGALDVIEPRLAAVLRGLEPQQTSEIIFHNGDPVVARLNQKQVLPARPLSQVSEEVRKSLVPIQLKQQIKELSDELMKTAQVEYLD